MRGKSSWHLRFGRVVFYFWFFGIACSIPKPGGWLRLSSGIWHETDDGCVKLWADAVKWSGVSARKTYTPNTKRYIRARLSIRYRGRRDFDPIEDYRTKAAIDQARGGSA